MSATSGLLPRRPAGPAFRRLAITELKLFLREKAGVFWGVAFPLVLLIIFGSIPSFHKPAKEVGGISYLTAYVPILIALVLALLAISALPAVLASYREKGILRRLATTPVGPARMLGAQLAVQGSVTVVTVVLLLAVARIAYGVPLPGQPGPARVLDADGGRDDPGCDRCRRLPPRRRPGLRRRRLRPRTGGLLRPGCARPRAHRTLRRSHEQRTGGPAG